MNAGLKKILSKMGISLLSSYHGAQIFEIYGLGEDVVDLAFKGTVSRIGKEEQNCGSCFGDHCQLFKGMRVLGSFEYFH